MANFNSLYFNSLNTAIKRMGVKYRANFMTVTQSVVGELQPLNPNFEITEITFDNGIAVVKSLMPNIFKPGQILEISGADQPEYNGRFLIFFLQDPNTFWIRVAGAPESPATGEITATYSVSFNGIVQNRTKKEIGLTAEFSPIMQKLHMQASYDFDEFSTSPDYTMEVRILMDYLGKPYQIMNKKLVANSVYEYDLELYNGTP